MKKELLSRLLELNEQTFAIGEQPHEIPVSEVEKSLLRNRRQLYYFYYPVFVLFAISTFVLLYPSLFNLNVNNFQGYKVMPAFAIMYAWSIGRKLVRIEKIKEQLFICCLLQKINK